MLNLPPHPQAPDNPLTILDLRQSGGLEVYSVSVGTDLSLAPPQMGKPRHGTLSLSECFEASVKV